MIFSTITLMICLWVLVLIFNIFGFVASRRMANLGYVLWITAMTPSFLSFCIIGDNLRCEYAIKTPKLISDINSTQLPGTNSIYIFLFIRLHECTARNQTESRPDFCFKRNY